MIFTISSLIAILSPLDLGIGNGLMQVVSDASGRDDRDAARRAVSTALVLLTAIAFGVAAVALVANPAISWARIFNVTSSQALAEAGPAALALITIFAIGLPLSIAGVVQSASQSGYVTSLWSIVGSVGSLAALLTAIQARAGLPLLIIALAGAGLVAALLNGILLFGWQRPWLTPRLRAFRARVAPQNAADRARAAARDARDVLEAPPQENGAKLQLRPRDAQRYAIWFGHNYNLQHTKWIARQRGRRLIA